MVLTVVIVFAIQFQVSQMENLEEVSGNWISGEGGKAAASFHIANQGEQIGKITESTKKDITGKHVEGCLTSLPGVRSQDIFRFTWVNENECGSISDSFTRVKIPIGIEENGEISYINYLETGVPPEESDDGDNKYEEPEEGGQGA